MRPEDIKWFKNGVQAADYAVHVEYIFVQQDLKICERNCTY